MQLAEPERTCVGCRQVKPKRELVRVVATETGAEADLSGRRPGRGAYLCRQDVCWREAARRRSLDRALHLKLDSNDWSRLRAGILTELSSQAR
ncbi:MAG: YlxR family protein [Chloroflexi bacterium]|nr:MAG: YlxR family protein [Chloroflexota bacterium]